MLFYEGLRKMPPTAVIGNSVFVYRLERWPVPAVPDDFATAAAIDAERRLGDELMEVEWFSRAIVHYRRYLEHRANEPAVLTSLGYALMMTDQPQDAATALRRAIALSPDSGLAHMVLSTALLNARGNVSEIVEHARQAARVLPADPTALLTLGRALAVSGQFREAEAVLSRVLTIAPQEAAAHELLQRIRTRSRQVG
jgi:Flp pilus assembly protein TadD